MNLETLILYAVYGMVATFVTTTLDRFGIFARIKIPHVGFVAEVGTAYALYVIVLKGPLFGITTAIFVAAVVVLSRYFKKISS